MPQPLYEPGQLVLGHRRDARIREAHRVQHAAAEFGDPQGCVALPRFWRHCLGDEAAKQIEIDDMVQLAAKAGGAGSKEDRVLEGGAEKLHRIHGSRGPRGPGTGASERVRIGVNLVLSPGTPSSRPSESSAAT